MLVLHSGAKILIFILVLADLLPFKNGIQKKNLSYRAAVKTALLGKTVIITKYKFSMEPLDRF